MNIEKMQHDNIIKAHQALADGQIISFITDTVFALAGDATNEQAVNKIFSLKQRDHNKKLSLLVTKWSDIEEIALLSPLAKLIGQKYWPGALTMILPVKNSKNIHKKIIASDNTIGIRMPKHQFSRKIIDNYRNPIFASSANISGQKELNNLKDIDKIFGDEVNLIDDMQQYSEQNTLSNISSTVISIDNNDNINILRQGEISLEDILANCK